MAVLLSQIAYIVLRVDVRTLTGPQVTIARDPWARAAYDYAYNVRDGPRMRNTSGNKASVLPQERLRILYEEGTTFNIIMAKYFLRWLIGGWLYMKVEM